MPRIVLRLDGRPARSFTLHNGATAIGRAGDNDIVIENERVSRYHARIEPSASGYVIHDLSSTNGIRVNGEHIALARGLVHGDRIHLSGVDRSVELVFDEDIKTVNDQAQQPPATAGGVRIDLDTAEVWIDGRPVPLTQLEHRFVDLLYRRTPGIVSKEELAIHAWPEIGGEVSDANIEAVMFRLRAKLRPQDDQPPRLRILTVRGLGYRLQID